MRRNLALVTLAAGHLASVALAALVHFRARVAIDEAFRAYGTRVPPLTAVALSPLFLPLAVGVGFAIGAVGLAAPLRPSRRMRIAGAGLVVSATALVFSVWAAFAPLFGAAG